MGPRFFAVCCIGVLGAVACQELPASLSDRVASDEDEASWLREVMAAEVRVPVAGEPAVAKLTELLRQAATLPGVDQVAIADALPGSPGLLRVVSPGYFDLMERQLLRGRHFAQGDTAARLPVAIVNQTYARMKHPEEDVLGKRLELGRGSERWLEIVGVVEDGLGVAPGGARPELYVLYTQHHSYRGIDRHRAVDAPPWYLLVRVAGGRQPAMEGLRRAAKWDFHTLEEHLERYRPE